MSRLPAPLQTAESKAKRSPATRILAALLDAVVGALRDLPSTEVDGLPRMADFALWATAAEAALGWPKNTFMAAYKGNQSSANEIVLEASPIARPLLELLDERGEWVGTSSELLDALESRVSDRVKRQRSWPKNGGSLSGRLRRLSPNLRKAGWEVDRTQSWLNRARRLLIRWEKKVANYIGFLHLQFAYVALRSAGVIG